MRKLLALLAFVGTPALAQELDCSNAVTQQQMNACAVQGYEAADGDLNLAYQLARSASKEMDQYLQGDETPGAIMLRDAQRAWIKYRDLACAHEATLVRGGSMEALISPSKLGILVIEISYPLIAFMKK